MNRLYGICWTKLLSSEILFFSEIFWSYKIASLDGGSGVDDGTLCSMEGVAWTGLSGAMDGSDVDFFSLPLG